MPGGNDGGPSNFGVVRGLGGVLHRSPLAGYLVRYAYWSCNVFAVGTEVTAIAVYMHYWFPAVPGWVWIVGFSSILVAVNALNVKVFGAVEYAFSTLKVTAIMVFILLGGWLMTGTGISQLHRSRRLLS